MQLDLIPDMETFASRAKARRKELALTQAEVARASGLKQSDVSKIENGNIQKTTEMIGLARALRCSPQWLADGQGEMLAPAHATPIDAGPTPGAMELAMLYDMIPVAQRIKRAQAFTAAAAAIVAVLEGHASVQPAPDQKTPAT
jgi:transcriptional regulator with XRE-family HTH domain